MFNNKLVLLALLAFASYVAAVELVCPEDQDEYSEMIFFPHDEDCNKFYECDNGEIVEMSCAPDLHWNAEENVCDYPKNANCDL